MLWSGDIKIIDGIPTYTYFSVSIGLYAGMMQRKIPVIRYTDYWDFILFRPFNGGSFL